MLITARRRDKANEANEVHGKASKELPKLVLGIPILGQGACQTSLLLLVDKDARGDGCQNQAVKERESESLVLVWDDGSEEGTDARKTDDA